jgi:hypothetical protein
MAARYRKIDPRVWRDEKFRTFSQEQQLIALYAITAQSNRVGIFSFSIAAAAEDLRLPANRCRKGFLTVCKLLGWTWDENARVLYIPTWWKYNHPENPNVLRSCLQDLHDLPQTRLLSDFSRNTQYLAPAFLETFHQTFTQTFGEGSGEHFRNSSPKQEQEQEQKQDKDMSPIDPACSQMAQFLKAAIMRNTPDARVPDSLVKWADTFRLMRDRDKRDFPEVKAVIEWATAHEFWRANILSASKLREKYDTLKGQMARGGHRSGRPPQATGENGFVC